MNHRLVFAFAVAVAVAVSAVSCSQQSVEAEVAFLNRFPIEGYNANYVSAKAPLVNQQLIKLPVGSIMAEGWLKQMLHLQKDGLNGHLNEISAWLDKNDNAWLTSGGKWGWEEVPYWLRGYGDLAYLLNDAAMIDEAKIWVEAILNSQEDNGDFGPVVIRPRTGYKDLWPNMLALWILQSYYEFTQDARVIDFMTKYFHYQLTIADEQFLEDYWENSRAGDNLWSVKWLYNRTQDPELLTLADKLHANTADWTQKSTLPNWHVVNVAQSFREPAIYYMFNGDSTYLAASYNAQSLVRRAFGQVPGGMFAGDENSRMGYFDPRQGTETCAFAEQMASDEIMLLISGDPMWAENCEDVTFNSYPAAFMPDMKALRYITSPNQVVSDSKNHAPGIDNDGPFMAMNPFSSRCCQHNHGFAWPYFTEHLILATQDNGVAAVLYSPCRAKVKVADGQEIILTENTNYPFEESIEFVISSANDVQFPLYLRIPRWTKNPSVKIGGKEVSFKYTDDGNYLRINRTWKDGDKVLLYFPMHISMREWAVNKHSVSVDYGPLTLSLKIDERYENISTLNTVLSSAKWQKDADPEQWPSYEIYPESAWNYALMVNEPITVERKGFKEGVNPFTLENIPLIFKASGRKIPSWTIDKYGLCDVLPYEDAPKAAAVEPITLVPMGAARLRISAFPQASE